jgi:hypothetical protein
MFMFIHSTLLLALGNFFSWALYSSPNTHTDTHTHTHTHMPTGWQVSATGDTVLICRNSLNLTHSGYSSHNQCNQEVPCDVWQGLVFRIVSVYKLHCEHCNWQNVHERLWPPWLHEGRAGARGGMLCKYLIPMEALLVLLLDHCQANAAHIF